MIYYTSRLSDRMEGQLRHNISLRQAITVPGVLQVVLFCTFKGFYDLLVLNGEQLLGKSTPPTAIGVLIGASILCTIAGLLLLDYVL